MNRRHGIRAIVSLVVGVFAAFLPTATSQAQTRPDPGAIAGVVSHDGQGVADATVVLYHNDAEVARTTTGPRGAFEFGRLRAGDYMVIAGKDGLGRARARASVAAGQVTRVRLNLPGLGQTAGAIAGLVTTEAGRPVPGAAVVLSRDGQAVARTTTNDDGRYDFANLRPGQYGLEASKRGVGNGAARAEVRAGETTRAPIVLRAPAPTTGAIVGQVSSGGAPVAEAGVALVHDGVVVAQTVTNARGAFSFPRVRPGTYAVVAAKRGVGEGRAAANVRAGLTTRVMVEIRQQQGPGAIAGSVASAAGPVADAAVVLSSNGVVVARTSSARNGSFAFPNLRPGRYVVEASKRGVGQGRAVVEVQADQTAGVRILLQ
ncbi:MAG: carboxypeptidase regulatory-like domain-containing protein [Phycisphaeraceae bacterium]|nr:MAG: carboxypeptidase regulatory-like domain-containing protein [Phycisphaeraceae bacterium]